ncbi:general secretion pathway protein [Nitrincola sp. A-D6]|uniref:ExeA family protein n=1 Tax=Nitrincola sp. A-D6 TaxID=1545442 RepID=UPI00051FBCC1|nr:AAA family ATPase [Nitrincola sp. A-D6]KGK42897.1 general secretion pathway protein [Nitrincola sp. A-D6]
MYREFFGLKEKPFSLTPDPAYLYLSKNHTRAQTMLEYGLMSHAGFTVITGDIGAGKTTLVHHLIGKMDEDTVVGVISNTHAAFGDLMSWVLDAFEIKGEFKDNAQRLRAFTDYVIDQYSDGKHIILIIDEAQNLTTEILEELRLISNINVAGEIYLQMMLIGQPELIEKLNQPELTQFAQRIGVEFNLRPMDFEDTKAYIQHRIQCAGGDIALFTESAMGVIFCYAEGVPRRINTLCDMSLVYAFADEQPVVDADLVMDMIEDRSTTAVIRQSRSITDEVNRVRQWLQQEHHLDLL